MKPFLLVNNGMQNERLQIQMNNGTMVNEMPYGGAVSTDDGAICLAPTTWPEIPETTHTSTPIVIRHNVIIQIGNTVIPYLFNELQLGQFFKTGNPTGVVFEQLFTEPQPELGIKYQVINTRIDRAFRVRIFSAGPDTVITPEVDVIDRAPVFKLDELGSSYAFHLMEGNAFHVRVAGILDVDIMDTGTATVDGEIVLTDEAFIIAIREMGLEVVEVDNYITPNYFTCEGSTAQIALLDGISGDLGEMNRYMVIINGTEQDVIKCNSRSISSALWASTLSTVLNNLSIGMWDNSGSGVYFYNPYQQPFSMEIISLDEGVSIERFATQISGSPCYYLDLENNSLSFCIAEPPDEVIGCVGNSSFVDLKIELTDNAICVISVINNKFSPIDLWSNSVQVFGNMATVLAKKLSSASNLGLAVTKSPLDPTNPNAFRLLNTTDRNNAPVLTTTWQDTDVAADNTLEGIGDLTDVVVTRDDIERIVSLRGCLTPATLTSSIEIDFDGSPDTGLKTLLAAYGSQALYVDGFFYASYMGEVIGEDVATWFNASQNKVVATYDSVTKRMVFDATSNITGSSVIISFQGNGTKWTPYPTLNILNYIPANTSFVAFEDVTVTFSLSSNNT